MKTILKIPGGSGDQMTSYLKKIGFTNQDGTPSDAYKKFRNPISSGEAIASIIKIGYSPLYVRNEYMHELSDQALVGLITEETGQPHDSNPVKLTFACIKHLKAFADFKAGSIAMDLPLRETVPSTPAAPPPSLPRQQAAIGLNLGYTINLNLPATSDPEVFDAIFKSLKEHLLSSDDA